MATKNKLTDLNDHLFAQLERLDDENLTPEQINHEVSRAKAISNISAQIIKANKLVLDAVKMVVAGDLQGLQVPDSLGIDRKALD